MTKASRRHEPRAPSLALLALEPWRATIDLTASFLGTPPPRVGDGHAVLVLPGLGAGDWSTLRLRRALDRAGFLASAWGQGLNRGPEGDFDEWLAPLEEKVLALHRDTGRKVSLVGWSLGGIYARELAKRLPQQVRQVITLGTPFAGVAASNAQAAFRLLNRGRSQLTPGLQARLRQDPPVPATALYSRTDGVVAWQSCMLRESPRAENIEVSCASHCGMGAHPQVLRIVVDRLAQPDGQWRPWQRPDARHPTRGSALRPHSLV